MFIALNWCNREIPLLFKTPELFAIIITDKIGVITEKFTVNSIIEVSAATGNKLILIYKINNVSRLIIIRKMALTTT